MLENVLHIGCTFSSLQDLATQLSKYNWFYCFYSVTIEINKAKLLKIKLAHIIKNNNISRIEFLEQTNNPK